MNNSISYKIYSFIKNIYINSIIVKAISKFLSFLFFSLINSKIFNILSNKKDTDYFKESVIYKLYLWLIKKMQRLFYKKSAIQSVFKNSFFINNTKKLFSKESLKTVKMIYLIGILTLIFNIIIKILFGNFILTGNKNIIILIFILSLLYILDIDFVNIVRNSKAFKIGYKILNDIK
ncbi:hypothetical protein [Caminicella sporogenes]|uniref:hypothetical protein n=1 Tax=Caminicella sporogenes TaxID=166485 RepID=UPI0025419928|nr:hypothetical protein [Caminicella sporogenes]WIF95315.1 hypothetical protein QNI18_01365 [Caminicella sporogenes]